MTQVFAFLTAAVVALALGAVPVAAQPPYAGAGTLLVEPTQLSWRPAPSVAPGATIAVIEGPIDKAAPFTFRLALPAGAKIAPHTHPAYERVTVLSGTLYFAVGEAYDPAKARGFGPGSVAIMPSGTPMFGYTKEATVIQVHGMGPWGLQYVNPAEDPRKK